MYMLIFFLVSLIASTIGAIAGIGGGVIIKPVLDGFQLLGVSTISFLSGCTVLSMSTYSVICAVRARDKRVQPVTTVPLGLGAAIGGVAGKALFKYLEKASGQPDLVGAAQSICLLLVTVLTFVYTLNAKKIPSRNVRSKPAILGIGLGLGVLSSFLGIGGGPINLMVLQYCFSMDIRVAAQNSLVCIFLSQIASLLTTFISGTVPEFSVPLLCLMIAGGIGGGIIGRKLNKRLESKHVQTLFCATMVLIILLSIYNAVSYLN